MIRLAALLALAATTSACTMSREAKTGTILGGVATTAVGALVYSQGPVDSDMDGINENPLNDNLGAYMLGSVLVAVGLGLVIGGLAAPTPSEEDKPTLPTTAYMPAYVTPSVQMRTSLPELPANAQTIQMAQQIRALAGDGHCTAAWQMWHRLDALDHTYALAFRSGGAMDLCPEQSSLSMR